MIVGTGDIAHARLRRGRSNDATAAPVFIKETISRLRQAGATREVVLPADSGFYLREIVETCLANDVRFSIAARMIGNLRSTIEAIPEQHWRSIDYFLPGAGVTEITWTPFKQDTRGHDRPDAVPMRLLVRRTQPTDAQAKNQGQDPSFPIYDYHPIITDTGRRPARGGSRPPPSRRGRADHPRPQAQHGSVPLPDQELRRERRLADLNTLAHNLTRWTTRLGLGMGQVMTKTVRRRIYTVTGRLVRTGRRVILRLPRRWPWAGQIPAALARLRSLPAASG